jgi:hypothetical protein
MQEDQPQFQAEVQIGKTWRYIDRNGKATIDGGRLTLQKRKGDVIAEAPINEVWTDIVRGSVNIWIGGERFILTPLRVSRAYQGTLAGSATKPSPAMSRQLCVVAPALTVPILAGCGGSSGPHATSSSASTNRATTSRAAAAPAVM